VADADTQPRELFGHLLPLQGVSLLLPKPAVLEVLGLDSVALDTDGPNWLLGFSEWHGRRLPAISIEALAGESLPTRSRRSRLVVINSLGTHLENGLFAVVIQGYPHLTGLNPAALQRRPDLPQDADVALSRVRLANTEAIIPDLEAIEARLAEVVATVDQAAEAAGDWEPRPPVS